MRKRMYVEGVGSRETSAIATKTMNRKARWMILLMFILGMTLGGCATAPKLEDVRTPVWVPKLVIIRPVPLPPAQVFRFQRSPDCIHLDHETFRSWIEYMYALQDWIDRAQHKPGRMWSMFKVEPDLGVRPPNPISKLHGKF